MLRAPAARRRLPEPSVVYTPELLLHGPQHAVHFRPQRDPMGAPAPTAWLLGWLSADWCRRASMQIRAALTLDVAVDRAWGPRQFAQNHEGVVIFTECAANCAVVDARAATARDWRPDSIFLASGVIWTRRFEHAQQALSKRKRVCAKEPLLEAPPALRMPAIEASANQVGDGNVHRALVPRHPGALADLHCGKQQIAAHAARLFCMLQRMGEVPATADAHVGHQTRLLRPPLQLRAAVR